MLLYAIDGPAGHIGLREFEVYGGSGGGPYPLDGVVNVTTEEDMWSSEGDTEGSGQRDLLPTVEAETEARSEAPDAARAALEALPPIDAPSPAGLPNPS